ncbi:venom carboxylesterase-6-like [Chironomus tepperi]|uniref:venom carboxylesterase-6-like n=1 Tax=Chironomus tepperi TaxID=113505 RepID=UPI00391F2753
MRNIILCLLVLKALISQAHIIAIENGKISGVEYDKYFAYKGIKYATASRFSLPKPIASKWCGIKDFRDFKQSCAQYDHLTYEFYGVEDCLFLNVFVPKKVLETEELAPVIFYIHGGAFMFGGGSDYLPDHIMDNEKMILVTINYRLGILGFLSTEDEVLPGNLGMKDQVEALKWVQRNIKAFNGDPNKVTISGFSAGGASVQLHYLSPLSKGLFKNGISHSGNALDPWVFMENARSKAHKVAEYMDCPYDDHQKMLECLKQKPTKELVVTLKNFQPFLYNPFSPLGLIVEPAHDSAFISEHPRTLLKSGKFNNSPWLLAQAKDEGLYPGAELYSKEEFLEEIDQNFDEIAPYILHFNEETDDKQKLLKASRMIRKFYMGDKKISRENFELFENMLSDRLFKFGAYEAIQLQSKYSPSFFYHFVYKSVFSVGEIMGNTTDYLGISHGEDIFLIFTNHFRPLDYTDDEKKMAQNLLNMYYEFSVNNLPKFDIQVIHPSLPDAIQYLEISSNQKYAMKLGTEKFGNVKFWKDIEKVLHSNERIIDEL